MINRLREQELINEAKRLGWSVEELRNHYAKEERISSVFSRMERQADLVDKFERENKSLVQRLKERVF